MRKLRFLTVFLLMLACSSEDDTQPSGNNPASGPGLKYYGADLSYVNEMEDCGAAYFDVNGTKKDPYLIFSEAGTNLVRLRLWHSPNWTNYSTFDDVKKSIRRAKDQGMEILLDFHYSDDWADPGVQEIPAAWLPVIDNTPVLGDSLYNYTYHTLEKLHDEDLLPEMVQVGNEINPMILQHGELEWPIDWSRNAPLINKGIEAVRDASRDFGKEIGVMLHIAQPENGLWWFEQAKAAGVTDFDWIGLSYYPMWSRYDLSAIETPLRQLIETFDKRLMIVETAYPFTTRNNDEAGNILGTDAMVAGIEISQQGQLEFLKKLEEKVLDAGGEGLIYWEPAWISSSCTTRWGNGSHWDNATLFDFEGRPTLGMQFYNAGNP